MPGMPRQRATIDHDEFERLWTDLRYSMDSIFHDSLPLVEGVDVTPRKFRLSKEKWVECFNVIYMLINAGPSPHSENLYNNVRQYLLQTVDLKRNDIAQDDMDTDSEISPPILIQYHYFWQQYSTSLKTYNSMFHGIVMEEKIGDVLER